ncbi:hypothetical protein DFH08DRAFT_1023010 [Mycena albidolilacea]|uniref:Transcription factor domain-containing protein n=1 Tax=Mycena albidolilacea TaxID=1033008 RepID=A0AAD6ZLQ3_9AGAR|nr:hypothetical protein DFH08DRAFT_1023010 [Mycena albidolilacea]
MAEEPDGPIFISFDIPPKIKACINCSCKVLHLLIEELFIIHPQKCDGERPKCGPCRRSIGFRDCEYVEEGPTPTQRLEEQIAVLEARIQELETEKQLQTVLSPHHPSADRQSSDFLQAPSWRGSSVHVSLAHSEPSSGRSSPSTMRSNRIPLVELEPLVQNFLHHSSQFGFFLHVQKFREAIMGQSKDALLAAGLPDVVYLWAIHLSGSKELIAHEATYLSHALRATADTLSGQHHNTVLHSIQSEVLISLYFMRNMRFLEGKYHLSAAVSLVISCGLHRIRTMDSYAMGGPLGPAFHSLPPPRNAIEECERIGALWTVLTMNDCWTTADGSPSNISYSVPDARIDTPWPLDIDAVDLQIQTLPDSSLGTVTTFLENLPDSGVSEAALHAKAAILFEQASRLAAQYSPKILVNKEQLNQFYLSFNSIDDLIEGFKLRIPTVQSRKMLVIHSLVHVATIQLHNPFIADNDASRFRVLGSARAIVTDLVQAPVNEFVYIDPIMGTLLMATCQVFVTELGRLKRHRPFDSPVTGEERSLMAAVDNVLAVMNIFSPGCRLMNSQLITMQQLYQGI